MKTNALHFGLASVCSPSVILTFTKSIGLMYIDTIMALLPANVADARDLLLRRGSQNGAVLSDMGAGLLGYVLLKKTTTEKG